MAPTKSQAIFLALCHPQGLTLNFFQVKPPEVNIQQQQQQHYKPAQQPYGQKVIRVQLLRRCAKKDVNQTKKTDNYVEQLSDQTEIRRIMPRKCQEQQRITASQLSLNSEVIQTERQGQQTILGLNPVILEREREDHQVGIGSRPPIDDEVRRVLPIGQAHFSSPAPYQ